MKALRWHARDDLRLDDVASPRLEEPGDVIVAVRAAGVCGTDIEEWQRGPVGIPADLDGALTLGHEIHGEIADPGRVASLSRGEHVVIEVNRTCGTCRHCEAGQAQRCPRTRALGLQADGGFAEFVRAPGASCVSVPTGPNAADAVLAEPLAVAVHALRRCDPGVRDTIVVVGGGTVGQLLARLLRARGRDPLLVEPTRSRRLLAERAGVRTATPEDAAALVGDPDADGGADACFEAAGTPSAIATATSLTGRGGTVVLLGVSSIHFEVDPWWMVGAERTITSSLSHTIDDMREAVALISTGVVDVAGLITHRVALADGLDALRLVRDRPGDVVKCVIEPGGGDRG